MGLEIVEFLLAVEDRFRVVLPHEQVDRARTLGDLAHVVARVIPTPVAQGDACATARVFYRLRRGLIDEDVLRAEIRPNAELADLLPKPIRRAAWRRLRDSGIPLPRLRQVRSK